MQEVDDYTSGEFYNEFIAEADTKSDNNANMRQRINKAELTALLAAQCRYPRQDVEDVLRALWAVISEQLELGREFDFGGVFTAKLYKPHARRLYDYNKQDFKTSSARPRLKLVPTDKFARYLHKGIHAPVNYFPAQRSRESNLSPSDFVKVLEKAKVEYNAEQIRRQQVLAPVLAESLKEIDGQ
jgi:hypothetical protein